MGFPSQVAGSDVEVATPIIYGEWGFCSTREFCSQTRRRDWPLLDVELIKIVVFRFFTILNELPFVHVLTMALASVALACSHWRVRRAPILSALARARAVCSARGLALALASTNTRALAIAAPSACDPDDDHIELCCTLLSQNG